VVPDPAETELRTTRSVRPFRVRASCADGTSPSVASLMSLPVSESFETLALLIEPPAMSCLFTCLSFIWRERTAPFLICFGPIVLAA
jgi:hypothetical protein